MPKRKKRRGYGGGAGVFKTGDGGWRSINRRGIVTNVDLPEGMTSLPEGMNVIKNPFRTGQWDWRRARLAGQPRPQRPGGGIGGGVAPTPPAPPEPVSPFGSWGDSPYLGPWVEGFNPQGSPWANMAGGGYINLATGQSWRPSEPVTANYDQYEQSMMDTLAGLLKGF